MGKKVRTPSVVFIHAWVILAAYEGEGRKQVLLGKDGSREPEDLERRPYYEYKISETRAFYCPLHGLDYSSVSFHLRSAEWYVYLEKNDKFRIADVEKGLILETKLVILKRSQKVNLKYKSVIPNIPEIDRKIVLRIKNPKKITSLFCVDLESAENGVMDEYRRRRQKT